MRALLKIERSCRRLPARAELAQAAAGKAPHRVYGVVTAGAATLWALWLMDVVFAVTAAALTGYTGVTNRRIRGVVAARAAQQLVGADQREYARVIESHDTLPASRAIVVAALTVRTQRSFVRIVPVAADTSRRYLAELLRRCFVTSSAAVLHLGQRMAPDQLERSFRTVAKAQLPIQARSIHYTAGALTGLDGPFARLMARAAQLTALAAVIAGVHVVMFMAALAVDDRP